MTKSLPPWPKMQMKLHELMLEKLAKSKQFAKHNADRYCENPTDENLLLWEFWEKKVMELEFHTDMAKLFNKF
jgi:hypothetical protein